MEQKNYQDQEIFKEEAKKLGVTVTDEQFAKFCTYYEFLVEENEKYNLTAITEKNEVFLKHFLDCISGAPLFSEGATVADVGSGAGFPAIPLKIVRPDLKITCMDALQKRVNFLNELISRLELTEITAIHQRAEDAGRSPLRETFDFVTARAVSNLSSLLEYTSPLCKKSGFILAYKGDADEEIAAAKNALFLLKCKIAKKIQIVIDENVSKRTLLLIEKFDKTPKLYPRGKGKEKKSPL